MLILVTFLKQFTEEILHELVTSSNNLMFKRTSSKLFVPIHNDRAFSRHLTLGIKRHAKWGGLEAG